MATPAISSTHYNPTFIFSRDPQRFGGQQADYLRRANLAIDAAAVKIAAAKGEKLEFKALTTLFFEIIDDFSRARAEIAQAHSPAEAEFFGKRRDQVPERIAVTPFSNEYEEYGEKIMAYLYEILKTMELPYAPGTFTKSVHTLEETCLGRKFTLQTEVLDNAELKRRRWGEISRKDLPEYVQTAWQRFEEANTPENIAQFQAAFSKFKTENPTDYHRAKLGEVCRVMNRCYPPPRFGGPPENMKSLWVRAVLRVEINKKMVAITQYFTWMYERGEWIEDKNRDFHPLEFMRRHSKVFVMHQDCFLIEETLQDIAQIFARVIQSEDRREVKDQMALLLGLSSLSVRDMRGSAAQGEWLEEAIFRGLEISCIKNSDKLVDLEAITPPFSAFIKRYDQMRTVQ